MIQKLQNKLDKRRREGTLRSLSSFNGTIDFHSNDYLGLAKLNLQLEDLPKGSTGSRLIAGTSNEVQIFEKKISVFFKSENALTFNSGYDANIGIFSSIPQRGDLVIYDEYAHASIRDGIRLSTAKSFSFKHNSVADLQKLLERHAGEEKYVVIESLYSMHGDFAPIVAISRVCKKYNAHLIVDEAHSIGVFGENGKGVVDTFLDPDEVLIKVVTFGKAYGRHGAAVLCSNSLKEYLLNFARSFIYTTALSPSHYFELTQILDLELEKERKSLIQNIKLFRSLLSENDSILRSGSNTPIQFIQFESRDIMQNFIKNARQHNIAVKGVFSPTVPKKEEGVRICIHSFNTEGEINLLVKLIQESIS